MSELSESGAAGDAALLLASLRAELDRQKLANQAIHSRYKAVCTELAQLKKENNRLKAENRYFRLLASDQQDLVRLAEEALRSD